MFFFKVFIIIYFITILTFIKAQEDDDFCIYFYKKPNYKESAGFICSSIGKGETAGKPKSDRTIMSFEAPEWLNVRLYEDYYYKGKQHVYSGSQKNLSSIITVQSIKWKHL